MADPFSTLEGMFLMSAPEREAAREQQRMQTRSTAKAKAAQVVGKYAQEGLQGRQLMLKALNDPALVDLMAQSGEEAAKFVQEVVGAVAKPAPESVTLAPGEMRITEDQETGAVKPSIANPKTVTTAAGAATDSFNPATGDVDVLREQPTTGLQEIEAIGRQLKSESRTEKERAFDRGIEAGIFKPHHKDFVISGMVENVKTAKGNRWRNNVSGEIFPLDTPIDDVIGFSDNPADADAAAATPATIEEGRNRAQTAITDQLGGEPQDRRPEASIMLGAGPIQSVAGPLGALARGIVSSDIGGEQLTSDQAAIQRMRASVLNLVNSGNVRIGEGITKRWLEALPSKGPFNDPKGAIEQTLGILDVIDAQIELNERIVNDTNRADKTIQKADQALAELNAVRAAFPDRKGLEELREKIKSGEIPTMSAGSAVDSVFEFLNNQATPTKPTDVDPKVIRHFMNNPDEFKKLPPDQQKKLLDAVRAISGSQGNAPR